MRDVCSLPVFGRSISLIIRTYVQPHVNQWTDRELNPEPLECKTSALPVELSALHTT